MKLKFYFGNPPTKSLHKWVSHLIIYRTCNNYVEQGSEREIGKATGGTLIKGHKRDSTSSAKLGEEADYLDYT